MSIDDIWTIEEKHNKIDFSDENDAMMELTKEERCTAMMNYTLSF